MKVVRHGKSSAELIGIKRDFFANNDALLAYQQKLAALYIQQPPRLACMCCAAARSGRRFVKQGVEYWLCGRCGHCNGAHVDTDAYAERVYSADGGSEYAKFYSVVDRDAYTARMRAIYAPKVEFLAAALASRGEDPTALLYRDFGAGSGYLVAAMRAAGLRATGVEVSQTQVDYGNDMIGERVLVTQPAADTVAQGAALDADVVTMIGTLEHLQQPREFLRAVAKRSRVRYLMLSVPLFAPTVFLEMVFPRVMQRQLSGGHTHLYTSESLAFLAAELEIEPIAEWWFGTDLVDLYRSVLVELQRSPDTAEMADLWTTTFTPMIDAMQLVIDQRSVASEVHVVYKLR